MKQKLKEAIKIELSLRGSQYSPPIEVEIQALDTFIAWPTNLVKLVSHEDSHITVEPVQRSNNVVVDDPLCGLIKSLYDIYEKPIELLWDTTKFGIPNVDASFFLTYSDVNETISGSWMSGAQAWVMVRCMDSLSLSPYTMQRIDVLNVNITLKHGLRNPNESAMKTLKTTLDGQTNQVAPQWIEVKWFGDCTPLDVDTMPTIHKKWTTYFLKVKNIRSRKR
ncbi:hypothetical protein GmHk_19G055138 [Glycine max]|nr:hypothetical protein GmHk_19G055138 [Glycine max]